MLHVDVQFSDHILMNNVQHGQLFPITDFFNGIRNITESAAPESSGSCILVVLTVHRGNNILKIANQPDNSGIIPVLSLQIQTVEIAAHLHQQRTVADLHLQAVFQFQRQQLFHFFRKAAYIDPPGTIPLHDDLPCMIIVEPDIEIYIIERIPALFGGGNHPVVVIPV